MSGTGNSYRVAEWVSRIAEKEGIPKVEFSSIETGIADEREQEGTGILGLVMPAHGFTTPWHMIKFACKLPRTRQSHAFSISTRAGLKFGKIFPPGLSGTATFLTALILFLKGYNVRGTTAIDMPSNWMSLHSGLKHSKAEAVIKRNKPKAESFMQAILSGRKQWLTLNNLYESIGGLLLLPVSVLYLFAARFFLAKLFFSNWKCNSCGICAEKCPVEAISMRGKGKARPYWKYNCESCMRCMAFCPVEAVEAGHSWGVILFYITCSAAAMHFLSLLKSHISALNFISGLWLESIFVLLYFYFALGVSYFFFSLIVRIPIINRLFTLTTLTHWYRRYHEPQTKLKDLSR